MLGFVFAKKKLDSWNRLKDASTEVKVLEDKYGLRDGDMIFQTSLSKQSLAIQLATHSPYSHCGIIFKNGAEYQVLEAIQPVKYTSLDEWMARGKDGHYVIKRLKEAAKLLSTSSVEKMKKTGNSFLNKNYDIYFDWSDDKMYCSELIWKIYKRGAGLEVGKLQLLRDFDLSSKAVKETMQKRYGNNIPLNDTVIAPVSIFNSELLETVKSN